MRPLIEAYKIDKLSRLTAISDDKYLVDRLSSKKLCSNNLLGRCNGSFLCGCDDRGGCGCHDDGGGCGGCAQSKINF